MPSTTRPNLIWIFGDQHRAQAMSCMGDSNVQTPNIDRLCPEGHSAIAGIPLCSPFRGSLLTSRYPHHCVKAHDDPLPEGLPTVATTFKKEGYTTAYIGKWHVDGACHRDEETRPAFQSVAKERRGDFDFWLGYENNNTQYDCWVHGHDWNGDPIEHYKLSGYETDALTELLIGALKYQAEKKQQKDAPFFFSLSVQPPHGPYVAPEEWMRRRTPDKIELRPNVPHVPRVIEQARRNLVGYYAMIENLDWNLGRVLDALEELGLSENTIVLFFSDHGDMHGSQGRVLKCVPWEESIRIPFMVHVPDALGPAANAASAELLNHVDIAPTSLGLCNIDKPLWMDGTDYSACFRTSFPKPSPMPDSAFLQLTDPGWNHGFATDRERPWRAILTADGWKYAVLEGQPWLMYNLNEDPFELCNIALDGKFRHQRQQLQDRLAEWIQETGDTFKLPDIGWVTSQ